MVIPQFGMIVRLSGYHWFYKLDLLVVYSMIVLIVSCSHFYFLNVLLGVVQFLYLYFSKFFIGLQCSSSCWVKENI
jgi:hypothetical protein